MSVNVNDECRSALRRGFSLFEISIVLAIMSVFIASLLPFVMESQQESKETLTNKHLELIDEALLNYYYENESLPCPANPTTSVSSSTFAVPANFIPEVTGPPVVPATCIDGSAPDAHRETDTSVSGVAAAAEGMVPVRGLDLADKVAFDGWAQRFTYIVSLEAVSGAPGELIIRDQFGQTRIDDAAYAVVSHGPNRHGGYTISGNRINTSSTHPDEHQNCDCDDTGAEATGSASFDESGHIVVQAIDHQSGDARFDDIVTSPSFAFMDALLGYTDAGCFVVGDVCTDGTVYVDGTIYAAPADETGGHYWGTYNYTTGATSDSDGAANTATAVADVHAGNGTANPDDGDTPNALIACDDKSFGGHDDWYLPARDELDVLYSNQTAIGGFGAGRYWSSTEYSINGSAYSQRFSDGIQDTDYKNLDLAVRCVRRD